MRKIACQPSAERSSPPSTGPIMRPAETDSESQPSAHPRRLGANVLVTSAGPVANIMEAPTAWMTRAAMSAGSDHDRAHARDPTAKTANPPM